MYFVVIFSWICFRFAQGTSITDDVIHHDKSSERNLALASNETCHASAVDGTLPTNDHHQCGIWLALSTIPGAGIGMYAGKEFRRPNDLMIGGDLTIPIVDPVDLPAETKYFLWDEYTWAAASLYMDDLGFKEVNVASPGFGASINSLPDFNNVKDLWPIYSVPRGLHRRSDPGVGAFTYYHSRNAQALSKIYQGDELLVSYGDSWFVDRKRVLGPVPLEGDHAHADSLYRKLKSILNKDETDASKPKMKRGFIPRSYASDKKAVEEEMNVPPPSNEHSIQQQQNKASQLIPPLPKKITEELWDDFVLGSPWGDSPTIAALQLTKEEYDSMDIQSLEKIKKRRLNRSLEWLQGNGVCADTLHMELSTIRQAGHGAFASWPLRKGTVVLPVPLIHIPDRDVLDMYDENAPDGNKKPMRPQLLLNYCMGHRDSTLLLSPYGPVFSLINHNQTLANVRLQWASPQRSQHNLALLNMTVDELDDVGRAQLAMELVALRDIEAGEEIFLDYGNEWEAAWQKHVQEWQPVEGADTYISAFEMNEQFDQEFRTESEQEEFPYPSNLMIKFHYYFLDNKFRQFWLKSNPIPLTTSMDPWKAFYSGECRIKSRHQQGRRSLYNIQVPREEEPPYEWIALENVPREALFFQDRPHTTDMFLENAFRHDLRIPDELFPEIWKNLKVRRNK